MANYSYITLTARVTIADFAAQLAKAVAVVLGPPWVVTPNDHQNRRAAYDAIVRLPGSAIDDPDAALSSWRAPGDDIGFLVELMPDRTLIAFRHGPNMFERWAQGCVEEELSVFYGIGVLYDATDRITRPGDREYSAHKTFRAYLSRNFAPPLSNDDLAFLDRYLQFAPESHRQ